MLNELFPLVDSVDGWLAVLFPLTVRIAFWGLVSGAAALALYAVTSPQQSIARLKLETKSLRGRMLDVSLDPSEFGMMARRNLTASLSLLVLVIGPALLSTIPVLLAASWLDVRQGFVLPKEDGAIELSLSDDFSLSLVSVNGQIVGDGSVAWLPSSPEETVSISVDESLIYSGAPAIVATPVLYKAAWWNLLIASEVGYLSEDSPVEEIYISVEPKRLFEWGPSWFAGWEALFFISVFVSALSIKIAFKIE